MNDNDDVVHAVLSALRALRLPENRFDSPAAAEALRRINPDVYAVAEDQDRFIGVLLDHVCPQEDPRRTADEWPANRRKRMRRKARKRVAKAPQQDYRGGQPR